MTMLELRPSCECCDKDLPPAAADAMICTFECTFCRDCVDNQAQGRVPELRRQFLAAADPARRETHTQSAVERSAFSIRPAAPARFGSDRVAVERAA